MEWITTSTILQDLADFENRPAWDRFAERFRAPIVRFARRMGLSEADAEDAAQETLLAFGQSYRKGSYDRQKGRLSHWLFGIAFRQALAKRRSVIRHAAVTPQMQQSASWDNVTSEDSASTLWEHEWEQALLELCLQRVRQEVEPATMRAFELVLRHGRTPAQAAEELNVPVKAVYNAKYTVLKKMREFKSELEEINSHDG